MLHLAIDLGAGSGRAMVGGIGPVGLALQEAHRFHYGPRDAAGHMRWDFTALFDGIKEGIRRAPAIAARLGGTVDSIGVDSWGVDYGLIDAEGRLIEDPICYRDARTEGVMEQVISLIGRDEVFSRTGIQFLPFNTIYQLVALVREGVPERAAKLLMIPDLCHHALCGSVAGEYTNASTTQLLGVESGQWDETLAARLGLPTRLLPTVVAAGTGLGTLAQELQIELDVGALKVIAPATHDTGSAVIGTPLDKDFAYISSGTWSLVGVERAAPLVNAATARANFTNEGGAFGTVRLLKNVMGLWLLERCRKEWDEAGGGPELGPLLAKVEATEGSCGLVFPDDPRFFNPRNMGDAIRAALVETSQEATHEPVRLAKVILDSLALRYASVLDTIESLTGSAIPGIHIVGGGSLNAYLNQATANASGRPVLAGPVEATALGNVLVQAIACGGVGSLDEGREYLRKAVSPLRFEPRSTPGWREASRRYKEIESRSVV